MIKIIADTTCGIPLPDLLALGIEVLPQIVTFENESYRDDTEIDTATFLEKLRASKELPKTAAPPHSLYQVVYQKTLDEGNEALVLVPSAEVSGTFRSAQIAAQDFKTDRIQIVDTRTVAGGLGSIVLQAKRWADEGMSMNELLPKVKSLAQRERVFFMVPSLEFLHKGGRIGGAAKLFGTLLQLVPILTVQDGKVAPYEKVRTLKQAEKRMIELVTKICENNPDPMVTISHCDNLAGAEKLKKGLEESLGLKDIPIFLIPPAIVVHAGPEILTVSCFTQES